MKIAITCHYASLPKDHPTWQRAIKMADVVLSDKTYLTPDELIDFIQGADALITGTDFMKKDIIDRVPECLKVISRPAVGYDRVDIKAARERGIDVCNAPGTNTDSVAELTIALLLSCARQLPMHFKNTENKIWNNKFEGFELKGKTIGILGLGSIGKEAAKRLSAFGMKILGYSRHIDMEFCRKYGVIPSNPDEMFEKCDIISLHIPQTPATFEYLNDEKFSKMKRGMILINTSRGLIVKRDSLVDALNKGIVGCYGTDVMQQEPPEEDDPLFDMDNVIITPHIGATTVEAHINMMDVAMTNALDILEGKPCKNIVNL